MKCFLFLVALALTIGGRASAFDAFADAGIDNRRGAQVPMDLALVDENGRAVTLREASHGKPIVLAPVLHRCPNICGMTLAGLADAVSHQGYVAGRDFTIVAFGIDPRETPADARESLRRLREAFPALRENVVGTTGAAADIGAATRALGYRYAWDEAARQYAHVSAVAVLTADGRLSRWLYGIAPEGRDLELALTEAGEGHIGTWTEQLLLMCYRYDPQTGRYGPLIWTVLRLAAAGTAAGGAGLIALALYRERRRRGAR